MEKVQYWLVGENVINSGWQEHNPVFLLEAMVQCTLIYDFAELTTMNNKNQMLYIRKKVGLQKKDLNYMIIKLDLIDICWTLYSENNKFISFQDLMKCFNWYVMEH